MWKPLIFIFFSPVELEKNKLNFMKIFVKFPYLFLNENKQALVIFSDILKKCSKMPRMVNVLFELSGQKDLVENEFN